MERGRRCGGARCGRGAAVRGPGEEERAARQPAGSDPRAGPGERAVEGRARRFEMGDGAGGTQMEPTSTERVCDVRPRPGAFRAAF